MISTRNSKVTKALAFVFTMASLSVTAFAQDTTSTVRAAAQSKPLQGTDRKPSEAKPLVAQYDVGHIVKRLVAVEAQVAELKKKNAALESQVAEMKLKNSIPVAGGQPLGSSVPDRLKSLELALRGHTHYMPNIGIMAMNALPGMQDIANKAGVGSVIEQWKGIKLHLSFGNGGDLSKTGLPIIP